ncbi:MAG: FAD-dependent thymidylate synthase [Actinobacteria bacterium]|nr:FAD-dependent thymidylate synthase [Actinomycetota bacterium]
MPSGLGRSTPSGALAEARACAALMLGELRFVIPAFLTRVDRPDRGHVHGAYLTAFAEVVGDECARVVGPAEPVQAPASVRLVDFDVDGEARVLAHALWPASGRPIDDVRRAVDALDEDGRARLLTTLAGERADRRHRPGRWLEATTYAFEIVCDYGAYRDLQRHRLLSLQAQDLTPSLGYDVPQDVPDTACVGEYMRAMETSAGLYDALRHEIPGAASYAVSMAHRVRFTMVMNAREAMHVIELRSQPQGHETYRAVAQEMHRLIAGHAGHRTIAAMMRFVDHRGVGAGRLDAEARAAARGSTAEVQ